MKKHFISVFLCSFILATILSFAANAAPTFNKPVQYGEYPASSTIQIRWTCTDSDVSHYLISIRYFTFDERYNSGSGTPDGTTSSSNGTVVLQNVNIGNVKSYTLSVTSNANRRLYKVAVCSVKENGSRSWSTPRYFYISSHNGVPNPPISFKIWTGFTSLTKEQIYYSSLAWYNALGTEYINTYPFSQGTSNNFVNNNDGLNCITKQTISYGDFANALAVTYRNSASPTEVDINLNGVYSSSFANSAQVGKYDVQSIVTHEMGHAIGLTDKYESNWSTSWTMYGFSSTNDISQRSLESVDIQAVATLYGQ